MNSRKTASGIIVLLTAVFLLFAGNTRAQNTIAFTPAGLSGWPDTAFAGDSIPVGAFLKNYGSAVFGDSLSVDGYVDTGLVVPFSIPYFQLYQNLYLNPGDSTFLIIPVSFRPGSQGGNFRTGNNVVVVWPVAVGSTSLFTTGDSISVNVFLIDTANSVHENFQDADIRLYPVPSNGPLYINSFHPNLRIEMILIRDASGRLIYQSENTNAPVDTQAWAPGIYTIEALLSNGKSSYYKIMR